MCKSDESGLLSQKESPNEMRELKLELPLELFSRLMQLSVGTGLSVEQLVAQEVSRLLKSDEK